MNYKLYDIYGAIGAFRAQLTHKIDQKYLPLMMVDHDSWIVYNLIPIININYVKYLLNHRNREVRLIALERI